MTSHTRLLSWISHRKSQVVLLSAIGIFLLLSLRSIDALPSWHEEISVHPSTGYRVLDFGLHNAQGVPQPRLRTWCGQPNAPQWVVSPARPVWNLCVGHTTFPVMVTAYFSGIPYWILALAWPFHQGDIFFVRRVGLIWGVLAILAAYQLATQFENRRTAAFTALSLSLLPPFVYAHTLSIYYEVVPWLALSFAITALIKSGWPTQAPSTRWLTFAAASLGFAILVNFKAIFLMFPIIVLALRARLYQQKMALAALTKTQLLIAFALTILPMIVFAWLDPSRGFTGQVSTRIGILMSHLQLWRLSRELINLFTFWSDIGFYEDLLMNPSTRPQHAGLIVTAIPFVYCSIALVHVLWHGRGPWLAAGCGALLWQYVLLVVLLYNQYPSANYALLHSVFGLALGVTLTALWQWLETKIPSKPTAAALTVLAAMFLFAPLVYNCMRLQDQRAHFASAINAHAEHSLAQSLRAHPTTGTLITTTYNIAGVLDSLGHGQLHPLQAQVYLHQNCTTLECMQTRWHTLLQSRLLTFPIQVVIPTRFVAVDEPTAPFIFPSLQAAAAQLGLHAQLHQSFATTTGTSVLGLYRVER